MIPQQKPGKSKQDYQTPPELLRAIERDFRAGVWACDLAADAENRVNRNFSALTYHLGPGSKFGENALEVDWASLPGTDGGDMWCNPPFAHIEPWAEKCATTIRRGRIFLLVPASVGSNWYQSHVHGRAHVVAVSPRVTFVGESAPYPKDVVIAIFGPVRGGFSTWRWK